VVPERDELDLLRRRAQRERAARQQAEKILEEKSLELYRSNEALRNAGEQLRTQLRELEVQRDKVVQAAITDPLTNLLNRIGLMDQIRKLFAAPMSSEAVPWLFLVHLKKFKQVNKSFGHKFGDEVLKAVAKRLRESCDCSERLVARVSGNEFAIVCSLPEDRVRAFAAQLFETVSMPFRIDNREVIIRPAIGGAGAAEAGQDAESLTDAADFMLSYARHHDANATLLYTVDFRAHRDERRKLESQVRRSVENREIVPWFQPIIHTKEPSIISLEALARWPAKGGLVSPGVFLPVCQDIGLGPELDDWLFRKACRDAGDWVKAGKVSKLGINVSPSQLVSPRFVDDLERMLIEEDFPPHGLVIEVTEAIFIENMDLVSRTLFDIASIGVGVALDDFGTGYSNLRSLVGLPLSIIKLDRSLIGDILTEDRVAMLVSTLLQWARAIDVSVVAEGVENDGQAMILKSLGCGKLQGFLYGRAMDAAGIDDFLSRCEPLKQAVAS